MNVCRALLRDQGFRGWYHGSARCHARGVGRESDDSGFSRAPACAVTTVTHGGVSAPAVVSGIQLLLAMSCPAPGRDQPFTAQSDSFGEGRL
jgi:hypothetical protein